MTDASTRDELQRQVIERALSDQQFRRDLVANPRETIERELDVALPDGVEISVVEETPSSVYVVLPPATTQTGEELSDADLEDVAGGYSVASGCISTACGCQPRTPVCK